MVELPVHDRQGNVVETIQFDESCLGKFVNKMLMHDAIVMYEANRRQGNASTKNLRLMTGTTKKPYRQKGTGRARMGNRRRVGSVGGATCHGPKPRSYRKDMPKKARRQAVRSALLSKFRDNEIRIISDLKQDAIKTKDVAKTLQNLKIDSTCLVVIPEHDQILWKSLRNIPATDLSVLKELNAYSVLRPKVVLLTKDALQAIPEEMK